MEDRNAGSIPAGRNQTMIEFVKSTFMIQTVFCPECHAPMVLRYTKKFHRYFYGCSNFPDCREVHGAHQDGRPLGIPANKETRAARIQAHKAFDRVWKTKTGTRSLAYTVLAQRLNIPVRDCHIGQFTKEQCQAVIETCSNVNQFRAEINLLRKKPKPGSNQNIGTILP